MRFSAFTAAFLATAVSAQITQISDGQPQASSATVWPISEYSDGQPQASSATSVAPVSVTPASSSVPAESTVYSTDEITITSCAATVTNCPARSTVVSKTTYPVSVVTSVPVVSSPAANSTWTPPYSKQSSAPATVTVTVYQCPTSGAASSSPFVIPSTAVVSPVVSPTWSNPGSTGTGGVSGNGTAPTSPIVPVTGAASSTKATFGLGAAIAIAAFFL